MVMIRQFLRDKGILFGVILFLATIVGSIGNAVYQAMTAEESSQTNLIRQAEDGKTSRLRVTRGALKSLLELYRDVAPGDREHALRQAIKDHRKLLEPIAGLTSEDPLIRRPVGLAAAAMVKGRYDVGAQQLQIAIEELQQQYNGKAKGTPTEAPLRRLTARILATRGHLRNLQQDFEAASSEFKRAAIAIPNIDPRQRAAYWDERGRAAEATGDVVFSKLAYQEGLRAREGDPERSQAEIAISLYNVGMLLYRQSRYQEAQRLLEEALALRIKALPGQDEALAKSVLSYGQVLHRLGETRQAISMYRKALKIFQDLKGEDDLRAAEIYNELGELQAERGDPTIAAGLFRQALQIREKKLGAEHSQVAIVLNNLALAQQRRGKTKLAERLYARALAIWRSGKGAFDHHRATSLNNLARLYRETGRLAEAGDLYRKALAILEQRLGRRHPQVATVYNNMAALAMAMGRWKTARKHYERALNILQSLYGNKHPTTRSVQQDLEALLRKLDPTLPR